MPTPYQHQIKAGRARRRVREMTSKQVTPPRGAFKGQNFMTPEFLGCYRVSDGYAELSTGSGFTGESIFGVTHSPGVWEDRDFDRSSMFNSKLEAMAFIKADCKVAASND